VWKVVSCAHCQQGYAYLLELEATGENHDLFFLNGEGSAELARAKAEENLTPNQTLQAAAAIMVLRDDPEFPRSAFDRNEHGRQPRACSVCN
jgi:hypothetical protein